MNIETINEPQGFSQAVGAMRNPMNSWHLSDSELVLERDEDGHIVFEDFVIGEKDKELSVKLQKAGPEHCKHLRMIFVWAEIEASLYWYKQLDTYRIGVEKVSTSTMHKITARPLTMDDFEHDCLNNEYMRYVLDSINTTMEAWRAEKDPDCKAEMWRAIIQALPESYIQKRTYCFSYAALRNIIKQRAGHKLYEWEIFINWAKSLPNSWMIFDEGDANDLS